MNEPLDAAVGWHLRDLPLCLRRGGIPPAVCALRGYPKQFSYEQKPFLREGSQQRAVNRPTLTRGGKPPRGPQRRALRTLRQGDAVTDDIISAEPSAPRRRRSETRQRTASISARLLPAERQAIERAAAASGCGIGTWAREILTYAAGQPVPARRAARTDLARAIGKWTGQAGQLGNNLNQLTRYAHEGGLVDRDALNRLTAQVRALHSAVTAHDEGGSEGE